MMRYKRMIMTRQTRIPALSIRQSPSKTPALIAMWLFQVFTTTRTNLERIVDANRFVTAVSRFALAVKILPSSMSCQLVPFVLMSTVYDFTHWSLSAHPLVTTPEIVWTYPRSICHHSPTLFEAASQARGEPSLPCPFSPPTSSSPCTLDALH